MIKIFSKRRLFILYYVCLFYIMITPYVISILRCEIFSLLIILSVRMNFFGSTFVSVMLSTWMSKLSLSPR